MLSVSVRQMCVAILLRIGVETGEYKNYQKNNRMDAKTSRETQVKVDGPGRRRPKEDGNCWLEGEGRG